MRVVYKVLFCCDEHIAVSKRSIFLRFLDFIVFTVFGCKYFVSSKKTLLEQI